MHGRMWWLNAPASLVPFISIVLLSVFKANTCIAVWSNHYPGTGHFPQNYAGRKCTHTQWDAKHSGIPIPTGASGQNAVINFK